MTPSVERRFGYEAIFHAPDTGNRPGAHSTADLEDLRTPVNTYPDLRRLLTQVVGKGIGFAGLSPDRLKSLSDQVDKSQPTSAGSRLVALADKELFSGRGSLSHWLGVRVMRIGVPKNEAYATSVLIIENLRRAAHTDKDLEPEPATPKEVVSVKLLNRATEWIALTKEVPGSIAWRLLDPIELATSGLIITNQPPNNEDELCYDPTIPLAFLDILESLKYKESEELFRNWLAENLSNPKTTEITTNFLITLTNFTTFLDSSTHREIWKPKKDVPGRQAEVLRQPFRSLLSSVEYCCKILQTDKQQAGTLEQLNQLKKLMQLRYGEVYRGRYQTSLYTDALGALIPTPADFAELALLWIENQEVQKSANQVANALIKTAESVGLTNIDPLLSALAQYPETKAAATLYARKAGLIGPEDLIKQTMLALEKNPWLDIAEINTAELIRTDTTMVTIILYTGTFGPCHKGHKDAVERTLHYMDFLESSEHDPQHQYLLLVIPAPDISQITNYKKDPKKIGPEVPRIASLILQLPRDPRLHITRQLQGDPISAGSIQGRVWSVVHKLSAQFDRDMEAAGRAARFRVDYRFAVGADEFELTPTHPRKLAKEQPEKMLYSNGVVLGRRTYFLTLLRNWQDILRRTGVGTMLLTPGTPYASSDITQEIQATGHTKAVEAVAEPLVINYWHPARQTISQSPLTFRSVGQVNQWVCGYLNALLTH